MRVMAREVSVDQRPGHYRREVFGRADRLENRLDVALQVRNRVPDPLVRGFAHSISMSDLIEPSSLAPDFADHWAEVQARGVTAPARIANPAISDRGAAI